MTRLDDEILMRRVDGELPPAEAARVDVEALADPAVAARLEAMRLVRGAARDAFLLARDPRDLDLARLIATGPVVRPSPLASLGGILADALAPRRVVVWGGVAAAGFVGGLILSSMLDRPAPGLTVGANGALADAGLIQVLDVRLSADGADARGRSVGLTFQDAGGRWCRTFQARQDGIAGLACRHDEGWAMQVLAPLGGPTGEVRVASADTPAPVLAAVDAAIAGATADAAAETKARNSGWR